MTVRLNAAHQIDARSHGWLAPWSVMCSSGSEELRPDTGDAQPSMVALAHNAPSSRRRYTCARP